MPEDIKRMRYYNGLFLQEEEFNLEQDYHVRMRRMHNARMHAHGIVWGLDVAPGTVADTVLVGQGMALDYFQDPATAEYSSREIIVVQDTPVDLSEYTGGDEVWLWIRYDEIPAGDDPDRGEFPFNTIETFQIEHSLTQPTDLQINLLLARIVINLDDTIDIDSIFYETSGGDPIRTPSGFAGPRVETDNLTLRAPTVAAPWAYMTGNEFQPGTPQREIGINVISERTRFTGPVDVEGNVDVQNDLIVQQNAQVSGSAAVTQNLTVSGDVIAEQNIQLSGAISTANASGAVEIADPLHVAGTFSVELGATVNEISTDGTLSGDSDTAVPTEQAVKTFVESQIAAFVNNELVGSVVAFATENAPTGWLECDGAEVSRSTYATLFARIGTIYGAGDGTTTFRLPDLRGEFIRGRDNGAGNDPAAAGRTDRGDGTTGDAVGTRQLDQVQGHKHDDSGHSHWSSIWLGAPNAPLPAGGLQELRTAGFTDTSYASLGNPTDSGTGHGAPRYGDETRARNVSVLFCIKY